MISFVQMTYTWKLLSLTVSSFLDSSILILVSSTGGITCLLCGTDTRTLSVVITIYRISLALGITFIILSHL